MLSMRKAALALVVILVFITSIVFAQSPTQAQLKLNAKEYFEMPGLNAMAFQDFYPEGHQGGISIIQNGERVATNGDLRLDPTPGQWQAVPKLEKRTVDRQANEITILLSYPDPKRMAGFNPVEYPDVKFSYTVHVRGDGNRVHLSVDFDQPVSEAVAKMAVFNLELYPGSLFGKTWYLGESSGTFPRQANGPDVKTPDGIVPAPFAVGKKLSIAPEIDAQRMTIESLAGDLELLDARNKHNNGWFIVRSRVKLGATKGAVEWIIAPHAIPGWKSKPVVHVSQVGYHPKQQKIAVIELDKTDATIGTATLKRIGEDGRFETALSAKPKLWEDGKVFLRYKYAQFDFTQAQKPGMYVIEYGGSKSEPFRIAESVYERGAWQPVLEYFLPIQMCHMRVEEQYKVWHGACHMDDARMAPVSHNHFDGYLQGPSTLTKFKPGETIPGMNVGGWHDAGDDDLRIESQADEVHIVAMAYENFGLTYDDTTVDETNHVAKIHQPDGKPDALQQVEHGVLTILAGYDAMGRFYRGMITPTIEQYVMLGDTTNVTDNLIYDASLKDGEKTGTHSGKTDDRWLFTEENAGHEYKSVAALAIAGRVMKDYNPALAERCLEVSQEAWKQNRDAKKAFAEQVDAAIELWLTTRKPEYRQFIVERKPQIIAEIGEVGWDVGRVLDSIDDAIFVSDIRSAVAHVADWKKGTDNPFAVPYRPFIWGDGWHIQEWGVQQYYLHRAFPEAVGPEGLLNALNFVLGVHPGENTASFASGVGARSTTIAYGYNRADWTYIPGGVASGTAIIRPDFPELKDFPFLWQQMEYVLGGGSSNYMFLVLGADQVLNGKKVSSAAK